MTCLLDHIIESSRRFILSKNLPCKDVAALAPWFKAGYRAADDICKLYFSYVPARDFVSMTLKAWRSISAEKESKYASWQCKKLVISS